MNGTILTGIVIAVLVFLVGLCVRNLVPEHRRGERCECIGDCAWCKIQCRSNPGYYGLAHPEKTRAPAQDRKEEKP